MALVKYNNNSISSVTSAASFPAGALTLIKTLTASSSANLSFVHGSSDVVLDSTYPIYKFVYINCHPANDGGELEFNGSIDSGSNYNVTKTTTMFYADHREDDSNTDFSYETGSDLAQSTTEQLLNFSHGNGSDESSSGELFLFNPSSTTFLKHFMARGNVYHYNNRSQDNFVAGYFNTTSAINGIKFQQSSGNIDSGTIKLYGIKDS